MLFVTNADIQDPLPSNIRIVKSTPDDFFNNAERLLNIKIAPEARIPYKICDYRPVFAELFSDYLKGYKYWAYGDIDIIYGNLERYLKYPLANNCDVISFREEWLSGAFTVVKNTPLLNKLYLQSPDYISILNINKCVAFDECVRKYDLLREGYTPEEAYQMKLKGDYLCWTTLIYRLEKAGEIKTYYRNKIKESLPFDERLEYRNGKILGDGGFTEIAIYHFVWDKRFKGNIIPQWNKIPDSYYIAHTGIYNENEYKRYGILSFYRKQYGKFRTVVQRMIDSYNYRVKRVLK